MKKLITAQALSLALCTLLTGCSGSSGTAKETVQIYSSNYETEIAKELAYLEEKFPDYEIHMTYLSSGKLAAKLLAEGEDTEIDIAMSLSSGYANQLKEAGRLLAFDTGMTYQSELTDTDHMVNPNGIWAGAIVVNTDLLKEKGLAEPTSYEDLLDPSYKDLIVMANPSSSATGYFFLLGTLNLFGEEKGWQYWDKMRDQVMLFSETGSTPVTMVEKGEAAIGLGMDYQALQIVHESSPVKVLFAKEGSPYDYDTALLIKRKQEPSEAVINVLKEITSAEGNAVFNNYNISVMDGETEMQGYPDDFFLMDMSGISDSQRKQALLESWSARYE